ncbi:Adhesion G protein-coupled receptor L3 [Sarcoptes scabiei]|uniref:Adhesion G protein-coupled receptor L3 n=1 Tax=Sarcoptes scabiei TaxID=52283 RepID=A0A834VAS1_SARSC|nr:Adhesion G protein-coupled receptor L3 [Sarcoptes scabiei]
MIESITMTTVAIKLASILSRIIKPIAIVSISLLKIVPLILIASVLITNVECDVHIRRSGTTVEDCLNWNISCDLFKQNNHNEGEGDGEKACIGQTVFFHSNYRSDWKSSRSYCGKIFHAYPGADLLYFSVKPNYDRDLMRFISIESEIWNQIYQNEYATSALCCPLLHQSSLFYHATKFKCKWMYNNEDIVPDIYVEIPAGDIKCRYLTVTIDSEFQIKFLRAIDVNSGEKFPFICTFKKPETCDSHDLKTTTPLPSIDSTTIQSDHHDDLKRCRAQFNKFGIPYWPSVRPNEISKAHCPFGFQGEAWWKCGPDGRFDPNGPHVSCKQSWIDRVLDKISKVANINDLAREAKVFDQELQDKKLKFAKDIDDSVNVVRKIQNVFRTFLIDDNITQHWDDVLSIFKSVIESSSKIIDSTQAWTLTESKRKISNSEKIMQYVHQNMLMFGCYSSKNKSNISFDYRKSLDNKNIMMDTFEIDQDRSINFEFENHWLRLQSTEKISNLGKTVSEWCPFRIGVGALFKKLSIYMFELRNNSYRMNSEIIMFNLNNETNVLHPLMDGNEARMSLLHHKRLEFGSKPRCVFWDSNVRDWNATGCSVVWEDSDRYQTTCRCNHLTNFAVLMDVSGQENPSVWKSILSIISCIISIVCLLLTISAFSFCPELKSRRSSIIVNISFTIIIIDLLVMFGLDLVDYPFLCRSIAVVLLYFLLAMFFWMLVEGYNLYQMMILIFNTKGRLRMIYLYLIGYGCPLIITIIGIVSIESESKQLTNEYFCWITSTKYPNQIWILVAPATIIILINLMILIFVMRIVWMKNFDQNNIANKSNFLNSLKLQNSNNGVGNKSSSKNSKLDSRDSIFYGSNSNFNSNSNSNPKSKKIAERISECINYLKGLIGLIFLMGITWLTYLLYINDFGHFFSYIFIILIGLQGFFIFITQLIFNKKAMNAIKRRLNRSFVWHFHWSTSGSNNSSSSRRMMTSTSQLSRKQNPMDFKCSNSSRKIPTPINPMMVSSPQSPPSWDFYRNKSNPTAITFASPYPFDGKKISNKI